ncbi:galactose ABC transporter substrate-binding protein [Anaerosacchariphilus polymeriproducens]|uniref:D-galactose/methyl-galactoside binding periplasmic protein MglB n=1 Tax=Anaerosacchariphilus polymeriproducens TaxID=1812858 RepID=A0A371AT01_9FIRM|nr:galactose ABC transporter substrate-binding protein [Anaerosacchariphilus polymeriproducens]RDU22706.1 galactose ABC transporter substrate-binding protein [Anaerosacchariphilus polymeriproducens]
MKKKIGIVLLVILSLQNFSGCSRGIDLDFSKDKEIKNIKIGISLYDQYDTFIDSIADYFNKAVREKEREKNVTIQVNMVSANGSQSKQNDQVEQFVEQNYDIICVNLVDRTDPSMIIDRVKNANIPTIFFNRELVEEDLERWDKLYYVGAVALESGIMQGKIMNAICKNDFHSVDKNKDGKIQYVMLEGESGHQDALLRTEYVIDTITKAGYSVERLGDEVANWNRAQAETKMNNWIQKFGANIEVVFANNDEMALGAVEAINKKKDIINPMILGIDGTKEAIEAIEQGEMTGTVLNDSKGQAESMLELAYSLVTKEKLSSDIILLDGKYIRLPYEIVTKDNVEEIKKSIK